MGINRPLPLWKRGLGGFSEFLWVKITMSQNNLIDDYLRIVTAVRYHLEDEKELGVMELPAPKLSKADDDRESVQAVVYNSMDDIRAAVERCRGFSPEPAGLPVVPGA